MCTFTRQIAGGKAMYIDGNDTGEHSHNGSASDVLVVVRERDRADVSLFTASEQQQLAAWNATEQDYPREACVPQLVAAQAAATPDAIALVMGKQRLSYRELNQRANQLAHYLQQLGVGPEVLVGICVERSLEMVVGLLGILKAGGAYVPMDASYPAERLSFMVEDAQVAVLVTQQHLAARFASHKARVICLDSEAALLMQQDATNPSSLSRIIDLAYVVYTSGSTGQPKGALITHDGLLNLVFWHRRVFGVTSADRATQVASPAFDATGWELWPYLTAGASVYLPDEDTRITPIVLRDWLLSHGITITFLPTALAESIMSLEWPSTTKLRFLLTGADKLQHYPVPSLPFALINNYGLSEATVVNTSGCILSTVHANVPPSIGRPIANTQIYLLDEHLRQVPIGEPGELYIGGVGLARGYLNRPELTAERFVRNPFSNDPCARLYKTGDLARFLSDGQIEFIGRIDQQIKIRGYRIEPSEIVAALDGHPAIQASAVVAREDTPGDKRLVAYVVLAPGAQVAASALQETLLVSLPEYMVPSTFVVLEALPLTPNGKVDRRALPVPDAANTLREEISAAPSTPTEVRVAEIVSELLGIEQVGVDDNFFMLGGHSLLGTQVIARVAETFGVDLALRTLFNAPTICQLSAEIELCIVAKLEAMSDEEALHLLEQGQNI
jgi:amino acid adenylation domain-containing protein